MFSCVLKVPTTISNISVLFLCVKDTEVDQQIKVKEGG